MKDLNSIHQISILVSTFSLILHVHLDRVIRKMKNLSESNLLQSERSLREEKILEMDGTVTTQPVLEHVGISTWPGESWNDFINFVPIIVVKVYYPLLIIAIKGKYFI